MTYLPAGSTCTASSSVSTLTPSHLVSSLVHFVTQLMSVVYVWVGSFRNSCQPQVTGDFTRPSMVNDHRSSGVCGVGPAERTGKSVTKYWPGGRRSSTSAGRPPPRNPPDINPAIPYLLARTDSPVTRDTGAHLSR